MSGTTGAPHNLPYPTGEDTPYVHLDLKALAEKVHERLVDAAPMESFFHVTKRNALTFPADGWNNYDWDTEIEDTSAAFTLSTNGGFFVAPRSGRMQFVARMGCTVDAAPSGSFVLDCSIWSSTDGGGTWSADLGRGTSLALPGAQAVPNTGYGLVLNASFPVVAGRAYSARPYITATGTPKKVQQGDAVSFFQGWYTD